MRYIAIPAGTGKRTNPRIYAIDRVVKKLNGEQFWGYGKIGLPPYYKVTGVREDQLILELLMEGTDEFQYVRKWVGPNVKGQTKGDVQYHTRRLLNNPISSGNVSKQDVIQMLST